MKKITALFVVVAVIIIASYSYAARFCVSGFDSAKTVQVRVQDLTSSTTLQEWTSTGVIESTNGQGKSAYCYAGTSPTACHDLLIDWQDNSSTVRTASEPITAWNCVQAKTDQLVFVGGKVDANATLSMTPDDIAAIAAQIPNPWAIEIPGVYGAGTAGYILGNYSQGNGNTAVNHNTGSTDNLRYTTAPGAGISGAVVKVFLKTDYDAGHRTDAFVKGRTITDVNGRWLNDLHLDAGYTYTVLFYKSGSYGPDTKEVTLP